MLNASTSLRRCVASTRSAIRWLVISAALCIAGRLVAQPSSQSARCLWNGVANGRGPHRYMERGDRCEGLYAKVVGDAGSLTLVSVVRLPHVADSASEVLLSWPASGRDSVWLLAESANPRLPYRMSSLRTDGETRFQWSLEMAMAEGLSLDKLPVLAWTNRAFAESRERVYLPLAVSAGSSDIAGDSTSIVLVPSVELRVLRISVGVLGPDGRVTRSLVEDHSLGHSYYPRDEPIAAYLPRQADKSVVRVTVAGQSVNGAPLAIEFLVGGVGKP